MIRLAFVVISLICFLNTAHAAIPAIERNALIALYNSTDGGNWTNNTNWGLK